MNRARGSVLILAVWVLLFLTLLAVAVGSLVGGMLSLAGSVRDQVAREAIGQAAAMRAAAVVHAATNTWDALIPPSWTLDAVRFEVHDLPAGQGRVRHIATVNDTTVTNSGVFGESGKLNINTAHTNLLAAYFKHARKLPDAQVATLIGHVAEQNLKHEAENDVAFRHIDELLSRVSLGAEVYRKAERDLTVYGGPRLAVNINTASREILQALVYWRATVSGMDADASVLLAGTVSTAIVAIRDHAPFVDTARLREHAIEAVGPDTPVVNWLPAMIPYLDVESTHFRGITYVKLDGATRETAVQEFVFDKEGGRFVYWREL